MVFGNKLGVVCTFGKSFFEIEKSDENIQKSISKESQSVFEKFLF